MPRKRRYSCWFGVLAQSLTVISLSLLRPAPAAAEERLVDLIKQINAGDEPSRIQAARAIAKLGPAAAAAVPALLEAAADASPFIRNNAAAALGAIGKAGLPELMLGLGHSSAAVQSAAARGIGNLRLDGEAAAGPLAKRLDSGKPQYDVLWALGSIGLGAAVATPQLIDLVGHDDYSIRSNAAGVLKGLGPTIKPHVDRIADLLEHAKPEVREQAALVLAAIGPGAKNAVPALCAKLADPAVKVRQAAAEALGQIGPEAFEAAAALLVAGDDPQIGAGYALGALGREAVPKLVEALGSESASRRITAAVGLDHSGRAALHALPALTRSLEHADPELRWWLCDILTNLGPLAAAAAESVRTACQIDEPRSRQKAMFALAALGHPDEAIQLAEADLRGGKYVEEALRVLASNGRAAVASVPQVLPLATAAEPKVREAALRALQNCGASGPEIERLLIRALDDENDDVHRAAIEALGAIPPSEASVAALAGVMQTNQRKQAFAAVLALGACGKKSEAARKQLEQALEMPGLQTSAASALWKINRSPRAVERMLAIWENPQRDFATSVVRLLGEMSPDSPAAAEAARNAAASSDPFTRWAAAEALASGGAPAVPVLVHLLDDININVRRPAAKSLGLIGPQAAAAVEPLNRSLRDPRPQIRAAAAVSLMQIDPEGEAARAVPALFEACEALNKFDRQELVTLLATFGPAPTSAVEPITKGLANDSALVRKLSAQALGRYGRAAGSAVTALKGLAGDRQSDVREAAAEALEHCQHKDLGSQQK